MSWWGSHEVKYFFLRKSCQIVMIFGRLGIMIPWRVVFCRATRLPQSLFVTLLLKLLYPIPLINGRSQFQSNQLFPMFCQCYVTLPGNQVQSLFPTILWVASTLCFSLHPLFKHIPQFQPFCQLIPRRSSDGSPKS